MSKYLIVVDMQNDFVNGSLGTSEAEAILDNVENKIKSHDGIVVFTYDTHHDNYDDTQEGKNLPVRHCIKGTDGWELNQKIDVLRESLENEGRAIIFSKPTFGSKDLGDFLFDENKKGKIDSIELIGLCTDVCVISNAILLKAFLPETPIIVDSSCCAGVTPISHNNALDAMSSCQIKII